MFCISASWVNSKARFIPIIFRWMTSLFFSKDYCLWLKCIITEISHLNPKSSKFIKLQIQVIKLRKASTIWTYLTSSFKTKTLRIIITKSRIKRPRIKKPFFFKEIFSTFIKQRIKKIQNIYRDLFSLSMVRSSSFKFYK